MALLRQCLNELRARRREFDLATKEHSEVVGPEEVPSCEMVVLSVRNDTVVPFKSKTYEFSSCADSSSS